MKVLIFNGAIGVNKNSTAYGLSSYFRRRFEEKGFDVEVLNLSEAEIPFFKMEFQNPPIAAQLMCEKFKQAELQIWLTPLFHGSMTGLMKNCLDWLELTSKDEVPYLTNKIVGLVCWAEGGMAVQGINAMDAVAKALRAWVLPYSVPIVKNELYAAQTFSLTDQYKNKFDRMINLLAETKPIKQVI